MNELLIWKKDCRTVPGNDPVAILNMNTAAPVVDHWVNILVENPDKFEVEMKSNFVFTERCAKVFDNALGAMLASYNAIHNGFEPEHVILSIYSIFQGFSFSEERLQREIEKQKQENDFDDAFYDVMD